MIRTLITPEQQDVSIPIPQNFVGRQIEVLLYAIDELTKEKAADFRGALKLTPEQYNDFQRHLKGCWR